MLSALVEDILANDLQRPAHLGVDLVHGSPPMITLTRFASNRVRAVSGMEAVDHFRGSAAGIHPKVVPERLGHASVGITLDIYSSRPPDHAGRGCPSLRPAVRRHGGR